MAKETYYFSHDSNALTDTKILNMRADYGLEGYGLYWSIIEMMRNEEDYKLSLSKNTYRAIKTLTNTTIDIEKYINDCIEDYELFKQEDEKFYSKSLLRRMKEKDKKSEMARERANKRWKSNANDMQKQCTSNANKIKENKINKNKENNNNNNTIDSCVDGLQDVIDFYDDNVGSLTPFGLSLLEDYVKEMGKDIVIYAMQISVEANKRTIQYIKAILNNWQKAGVKTLLEAQEESKNNKNNTVKTESEEEKKQRKIKELEESLSNGN